MTPDRRAGLPDATAPGRGWVESHEVVTAFGASIAYDQAMDFEAPHSSARSGGHRSVGIR